MAVGEVVALSKRSVALETMVLFFLVVQWPYMLAVAHLLGLLHPASCRQGSGV